jgi:hypothetical protein
MSDSLKDQMAKAGLVPAEPPKTPADKKKWKEELPEDETLPPLFDAPALTKPTSAPNPGKK